jgi:hypothetical protein
VSVKENVVLYHVTEMFASFECVNFFVGFMSQLLCCPHALMSFEFKLFLGMSSSFGWCKTEMDLH